SSKIRPVILVVFDNFRRKLGFFDAFYQRLSQFLGDDFCEVSLPGIEKLCCLRHYRRTLFDAHLPPRLRRLISGDYGIFNFFSSCSWEGFNHFISSWGLHSIVTAKHSFASLVRVHYAKANGGVPQELETLPIRYFVRLAGWCRLCLLW